MSNIEVTILTKRYMKKDELDDYCSNLINNNSWFKFYPHKIENFKNGEPVMFKGGFHPSEKDDFSLFELTELDEPTPIEEMKNADG